MDRMKDAKAERDPSYMDACFMKDMPCKAVENFPTKIL